MKWEQKKEQLYLGVVLFAATVAVFIEAGTNKGLESTLDNETSSDDLQTLIQSISRELSSDDMDDFFDMDDPEAMSCTDPRLDPLTNSTAHFGDCCSVYGVT